MRAIMGRSHPDPRRALHATSNMAADTMVPIQGRPFWPSLALFEPQGSQWIQA